MNQNRNTLLPFDMAFPWIIWPSLLVAVLVSFGLAWGLCEWRDLSAWVGFKIFTASTLVLFTVFVVALTFLIYSRFMLYRAEIVINRDLNSDRVIGDPGRLYSSTPLQINVRDRDGSLQGGTWPSTPLPCSYEQELVLASMLAAGTPFAERHFKGKISPETFRKVQDYFVEKDMAVYRSNLDNRQGAILTRAGERWVQQILRQRGVQVVHHSLPERSSAKVGVHVQ